MTPGPLPPGRVDLRLVPAALTAWVVTAAGIVWRAGPALACLCVVVAAGWGVATRRWGTRLPALRVAATGVIGAAVIGAGFGLAAGLRADAVERHPVGRMFGATTAVTLTPTESPRSAGSSRLIFHADLTAIGDAPRRVGWWCSPRPPTSPP